MNELTLEMNRPVNKQLYTVVYQREDVLKLPGGVNVNTSLQRKPLQKLEHKLE